MTTDELRDRRRDLEYALTTLGPGAPRHAGLRRQLDVILAEQDERAQIRRAPAAG